MINPFIYFTPIDWAATIIVAIVLVSILILWLTSQRRGDKRIFDAFGYVWRINSIANIRNRLNRVYILPTISVVRSESVYACHAIRYWSFDFIWLRRIYILEVEQLNKKRYE